MIPTLRRSNLKKSDKLPQQKYILPATTNLTYSVPLLNAPGVETIIPGTGKSKNLKTAAKAFILNTAVETNSAGIAVPTLPNTK